MPVERFSFPNFFNDFKFTVNLEKAFAYSFSHRCFWLVAPMWRGPFFKQNENKTNHIIPFSHSIVNGIVLFSADRD